MPKEEKVGNVLAFCFLSDMVSGVIILLSKVTQTFM